MSKFLTLLFGAALAVQALAGSSKLLQGSIDFSEPLLWNKDVRYGLDDYGRYLGESSRYSGKTFWYSEGENYSRIFQYSGQPTGYLFTDADGLYRSLTPLSEGEGITGPNEESGVTIPTTGLYIDSIVSMEFYDAENAPQPVSGKDKLLFWFGVDPETQATNLMITAGQVNEVSGVVSTTNYVTDATVAPLEDFRLTIKAIPNAFEFVDLADPTKTKRIVGFEIYVNNSLIKCGDQSVFASLAEVGSVRAAKLYSLGFTGSVKADKINFTYSSPDDPEYDKDDVSMLRECADITVDGYTGASALYGFPILVRISEKNIRNFLYSRASSNGRDIRFTDSNGKLIPCEIDTWNPDGESLVWVRVPYLDKSTKITMHWSLKEGSSLPKNNSHEVWSDYLAVWHMGDQNGFSPKDSTGNGYSLTMRGGGRVSTAEESVIGAAASVSIGDLVATIDDGNVGERTTVTFTGWYRGVDYDTNTCKMVVGTKYGAANHNQMKTLDGWCLFYDKESGAGSPDRLLHQGTFGQENYNATTRSIIDNWTFLGFSLGLNSDLSGTRRYACAEKTLIETHIWEEPAATRFANATTNDFLAVSGSFWADELRLTRVVRSVDWVRAEHDMIGNEAFLKYSAASSKGTDNYWVVEPSLEPIAVPVEEIGKIKVSLGQPRHGMSLVAYYDAQGKYLEAFPDKAGVYRATFIVSKGEYDGLRRDVSFVIFEKRAYHQIAGHDRVMLFNSDATPGCEVGLQGYSDVDSNTNTVWYHNTDKWKGVGKYVKQGSRHVYYEADTLPQKPLWEFRHARIGNLFQDDSRLADRMNFLPWSLNSYRFDDSEKRASLQRHAGNLLLQNRSTESHREDPAAAYSPIFDKGVGTVYFDAVNAYCGYENRLRVEMCATPAEDGDVTVGNWQAVPVDVFAIRNGIYDEKLSTNGVREIVLAMDKDYGTTNWFYRVRARIDTNAAVRVRIVRCDDETKGWGDGAGDDGEGLVAIDNIIVSYPAMGATLSQFGAPADPDNPVFRGQRAPFDIAFPSADDLGKGLHAQVKVNYIVNNTNENDSSFIGALNFRYRWRYLDQKVNDWKDLLLQADKSDPTRFISAEPLEGDGIGDIEYSCSAVVNAPFYEYWDYSGVGDWTGVKGLVWPDSFTERRGDVVLSAEADGVYSDSKPSPAFGKDYFVRLREGRSSYEGFLLHVKRADENSDREKVIPMELASDNTWRGFYQTLTNVEAGLNYRIEARNYQSRTGCDYQWSTNWFHGKHLPAVPVNSVLEAGNADTWSEVQCDAVTGYLMFQIEDVTRALTIIHADYQNFNEWTDAYSPIDDPYFTGTSQALPTSGVSRVARDYADAFPRFSETIATNTSWVEHFNVPEVSTSGIWAIEAPFTGAKRTPFGWTAENGMWVSERYRELGGTSMAFQMKSGGYGSLLFPQSENPRGIRDFTFSARIAQSYDIHSFNYYTGTNDVFKLTDYTFAVPCAMRSVEVDDEFTGLGSLSVVAHFRDSNGGYEARVERVSSAKVRLSLYKWLGNGEVQRLGTAPGEFTYGQGGCNLDGNGNKFGGMFISCSNTLDSVRIVAGVLNQGVTVNSALSMSGQNYYKVCYEDFAADRHVSGTFGVGSRDCPAVFARPVIANSTVEWNDDWTGSSGSFHWWNGVQPVLFPGEQVVIGNASAYDYWNIYRDRLGVKDFSNAPPYKTYGFKAELKPQLVDIEVAKHLQGDWSVVTNVAIASFGLDQHTLPLYIAEDSDIRIRTGKVGCSADVVVDDLSLSQWRGEDYDDDDNPDRSLFYQVGYGAPSNFVYTTAWIGYTGGPLEISAMRTTEDRPAGIRSPLMDGNEEEGRGLGLGSFSFAYRNADRRSRLIVQIATNRVSVSSLATLTERFDGWTDVQTFDFASMAEEDLVSGVLTCYIGLHGVPGVMRVVVDPAVVRDAHDPVVNFNNDPTYGQVFITMASAKDNPVLDSGSWWGWNLRTTDDPTKWLLKDGTKGDVRFKGMAYALNNSVVEDTISRSDAEYTQHMPFLQTPIFAIGNGQVLGEITFKARKYSAGDRAPTIAIYGTMSHDPAAKDAEFEYLDERLIDCDRFQTFSYQSPMSKNYTAFRLAVTGVAGIDGESGPMPQSGDVERVLIDEVAVFESIRARFGFSNVGAFRNHLDDNKFVPNVPSRSEQPLCGESWGVQTELYVAQLSERVDKNREPVVTLHWFEGTSPWGYENWWTNSAAKSAQLSRAAGSTNYVYRSSYLDSPDAIVAPTTKAGSVVQYSLEVVYYMEGQPDPMTNRLSMADWVKPEWYNPVDYNASFGKGESFAAFNIIDEIAPGWAWFNEVNLYGDRVNYRNSDITNQYVEVAAPSEANMSGWSIRLLIPEMTANAVVTNRLATFGTGGLSGTKGAEYAASNMVFHVIGSPLTRDAGALKPSNGTLDGTWLKPQVPASSFDSDGTIQYYQAVGLQLVRKTGIVEQEVVAIGTNLFAGSSNYSHYSPTNVVAYLNRTLPGANFFYVGDDDDGIGKSLGVFDSQGEASNYWNNVMVETPGRINENQRLNPDHPTPQGSSIIVYANLDNTFGHIRQTVGDAVCTNLNQILVVKKGSETGTNITYFVDEWYELKSVTNSNGRVEWNYSPSVRSNVVSVAKGCSNNVTITASAQVDSKLRELGCDESNKYAPAIIDWLNKRSSLKDVYGLGTTEWPDSDGVVYLADFMGLNRNVVTNMTLTEMYWLDICPTISNQCLVAGIDCPPSERLVEGYQGSASVTNLRMGVFMMISNRDDAAESPYGGKAWAPYVIRGLDPGVTSWDYASDDSEWGWTNVSFKITGILANGLTSEQSIDNWVPLRYFVFTDDSFVDYRSKIEVVDPHSPRSLGYASGWGEWFRTHPGDQSPIFFSWALDTRLKPVNVEILKPTNYLGP